LITAADIVDSPTWKVMVESLVKSYFERFIATSSSDTEALLDIRRDLDALHVIDRELRSLAKARRD
jgi:hypothetical protein